VEPVISGLVRTFAKIYDAKKLAVEVAVQPGTRFRGERQDLEEMVGNLIDNACKWAESRVEVRVEVLHEKDRACIEIWVEDDGPGLTKEARVEAPKRGRRLDETKPGSGLGLSIVADLANLYRGSLKLDEARLGGLRAILSLPGDGA
jgi:signal transduction histidine kinase